MEPVEIYACSDAVETGFVSNLLEAEGIRAYVRDLTVRPYPVSIGPLGERRIAVHPHDLPRALDLLRSAAADGVIRPDGILLSEPD